MPEKPDHTLDASATLDVSRALDEVDPRLREIAAAVAGEGGRALVVGGWVRDWLRGAPSKDVDVECFGLEPQALERVLCGFGETIGVGRAFGVFRVKGLDVDFSVPRTDSKAGPGHRGFVVTPDPDLDFATAARRRDLTVNSIGLDPLTGEMLDPHHGRDDLRAGVLSATSPRQFCEDPLRGLRVMQLAARLAMQPDATLVALCRTLDLDELSPERIFDEWRKLLLRAARPSRGLSFLAESGLIPFFPELAALRGVAQDPQWHPEGDVWTHTSLAVDAAAAMRDGGPDDLAFMLAVLCHDLGKPNATVEEAGRTRSPAHAAGGVAPTRRFLTRMSAPNALVEAVSALVEHHRAPAEFAASGAKGGAYRRLARRLDAAGTSLALLERVARADHLGRTTTDAAAGRFESGDRFLAQARLAAVDGRAPADAVLGRHLIDRGLSPGPSFKAILARCRDVQDETGWTEPNRILDRVLSDSAPGTPLGLPGGDV